MTPALADWQDRYRAGERLLADGKIEEAQRELNTALREAESANPEEPGIGAILDALGRLEFQAGRIRRAKSYFDRSLDRVRGQRTTAEAASLSNAGEALLALGEYTRALQSFRQALEIMPRSAGLWHHLGQALLQTRRYPEAEAALRKAVAIWEDSAPAAVALNDLSLLYQAKGQNRLAMDALERAIATAAPGQIRARMRANRGVLHWRLGQKREAEADLRQALGEMEVAVGPLHPDVGRILSDYSAVLEKIGRKPEAKVMARRAQVIESSFAPQTNSK